MLVPGGEDGCGKICMIPGRQAVQGGVADQQCIAGHGRHLDLNGVGREKGLVLQMHGPGVEEIVLRSCKGALL